MAFKKGNIGLELTILLLVIIVLGVFFVQSSDLFLDLANRMNVSNAIGNEEQEELAVERISNFPRMFDSAFVFFFIGIWVGSLVGSFRSGESPILLIVFIILMAFLMFAAFYISNQWDTLVTPTNFPMTNWFLQNFALIVGAVTFTNIIALMIGRKSQI